MGDPLTELIALLQPRAVFSKGISGAGRWAVRYTEFGHPSFCAVLEGRCRLVVATRRSFDWAGTVQRGARIRVATKYVKTAREHFARKGMHVDLIRLYGSMELAPLVGLADVIVDLVSTGNTLRANDLVAVEDIMPITSRLIVNPGALKLKRAAMQPLIDALAEASRP